MIKKSKSKSSRRWLTEHIQDEFVKQAQKQGLRSRAVFKLREINDQDGLIQPGMKVIDLGSSPGGWSQHAAQLVGKNGRVIALDILPMDSIPGVDFIQGDFRENSVLRRLTESLNNQKVHVILSDMAPNLSGLRVTDQARSIYLAELALDLAKNTLLPGGTVLVKMFQGAGFKEFFEHVRSSFENVRLRKPKASRPRSRELYLLARGFKYSK